MKKLSLAVGIGLLVFGFSSYLFTFQQAKLLGVVALLVVLWTNEGLPLGVVSLLPLILFPLLGILDLNGVAPNYSKGIIFLFLGGFLIAIAMQKSGLTRLIGGKLMALFPRSARGVIYAIAITAAALSAFLSNTTVTIMLLPIALHLTTNSRLRSRYLIALAYGASIGGIFTPIGTPPNLILLGFIEEIGLKAPSFMEWMGLTLPIVATMLLTVPWILSHSVKDEPIEYQPIKFTLTPQQRLLIKILLALVLLLLINPLLIHWGVGLNEKLLLLAAGLALFLPNVGLLKWEDTKEIPYEIIFLFGAGFSIAAAFIKTGLASAIASYLGSFAGYPLFLVLFLIALFVSFSTEITSNTALTSIVLPVIYEFAKESIFNPDILLFTATIAASYAFMLPIATPPNAIVMSAKVVKISQMAKIGFLINMIGVLVVTLTAVTLWRFYFG
ncbi:MAG: SLC13/DASS family transporter [Epsilonproteobacteria bacterium]|nr:anion transporter [Campylobacterota bacterium]NPA56637.1 SLC13/DASS family transporter [Campylobacterota bacterium]